MVLLDNEAFLGELTRMFGRSRTAGTVNITMKRYDGKTKPDPRPSKAPAVPPPPPAEYKCLVRAKLRSKKIATVVNAKDVNKFQLAYVSVLRSNMDKMKKLKEKKGVTKRSGRKKATQ